MQTFMPALAAARAMPRPMPSEEAVMYATLPFRSFSGAGCETFGSGGSGGRAPGGGPPAAAAARRAGVLGHGVLAHAERGEQACGTGADGAVLQEPATLESEAIRGWAETRVLSWTCVALAGGAVDC